MVASRAGYGRTRQSGRKIIAGILILDIVWEVFLFFFLPCFLGLRRLAFG